jgi:hypothetical protein
MSSAQAALQQTSALCAKFVHGYSDPSAFNGIESSPFGEAEISHEAGRATLTIPSGSDGLVVVMDTLPSVNGLSADVYTMNGDTCTAVSSVSLGRSSATNYSALGLCSFSATLKSTASDTNAQGVIFGGPVRGAPINPETLSQTDIASRISDPNDMADATSNDCISVLAISPDLGEDMVNQGGAESSTGKKESYSGSSVDAGAEFPAMSASALVAYDSSLIPAGRTDFQKRNPLTTKSSFINVSGSLSLDATTSGSDRDIVVTCSTVDAAGAVISTQSSTFTVEANATSFNLPLSFAMVNTGRPAKNVKVTVTTIAGLARSHASIQIESKAAGLSSKNAGRPVVIFKVVGGEGSYYLKYDALISYILAEDIKGLYRSNTSPYHKGTVRTFLENTFVDFGQILPAGYAEQVKAMSYDIPPVVRSAMSTDKVGVAAFHFGHFMKDFGKGLGMVAKGVGSGAHFISKHKKALKTGLQLAMLAQPEFAPELAAGMAALDAGSSVGLI